MLSNLSFRIKSILFPLRSSAEYWESRYLKGKSSGSGSYNEMAKFKAKILNQFIDRQLIESVIEFGSGDGNQLSMSSYNRYIGLDVSRQAILNCQKKFQGDSRKGFYLYDPHIFKDSLNLFQAECAISLDVIYHLVEDSVFDLYMSHLFESATKFVVIYSSNFNSSQVHHVRHRNFIDWVNLNQHDWYLFDSVKNEYPYNPQDPDKTSLADFYFFRRKLPSENSTELI